MLKARQDTFAGLWPLDTKYGFPSIEQIAAAGWYYDPSEETPNGVTCPLFLSAWDAGDDPMEEHQRAVSSSSSLRWIPHPWNRWQPRAGTTTPWKSIGVVLTIASSSYFLSCTKNHRHRHHSFDYPSNISTIFPHSFATSRRFYGLERQTTSSSFPSCTENHHPHHSLGSMGNGRDDRWVKMWTLGDLFAAGLDELSLVCSLK
jgi:hypothetical protein